MRRAPGLREIPGRRAVDEDTAEMRYLPKELIGADDGHVRRRDARILAELERTCERLRLDVEDPDGFLHVLRPMMAKSPADRYAHCGELLQDLEELQRGGTPKTILLDSKKSTIAASRQRLTRRPPTVRRVAAPAAPKQPPLAWVGLGGCSRPRLLAWCRTCCAPRRDCRAVTRRCRR